MCKITVFTPTYNRCYIIENLYKSLKRQTVYDFEWVVVDDGSQDGTELLFQKWLKEENNFKIKYFKVSNGGKHRAINKGLEVAKGELFFIVDSDDYLTNNSIEKIIKWESTIDINNKKQFAGISGNRGINEKDIIGKTFEGEYIDATSLEREKYQIYGDKAEVFYTEVLKKFKFPEIAGENFITESVVWNKIAYHGYKIRWFNEIIYICDYLEDGLTKSGKKIFIENPKGYALSIKQDIVYKKLNLKSRMIMYIGYYIDLREHLSLYSMAKNLGISKFILMTTVFIWRIRNMNNRKKV